MEGSIELDRKAFIIASIVVGFNFKNCSQEYHAVDFLGHFNDPDVPVNADEIKRSLGETSFQNVLKNYGLEYSKHKAKEDIYVGGPDRGRRIKNTVGGICGKVLAYEFPGTSEKTSCNYDNDERIKAITRKLLLSTISDKTPNPTVGTKRSFENISVETKDTEIKSKTSGSGSAPVPRRKGPKSKEDYEIEAQAAKIAAILESSPAAVSDALIANLCNKENPNNKRACIMKEAGYDHRPSGKSL
jgi:hypothetical protein